MPEQKIYFCTKALHRTPEKISAPTLEATPCSGGENLLQKTSMHLFVTNVFDCTFSILSHKLKHDVKVETLRYFYNYHDEIYLHLTSMNTKTNFNLHKSRIDFLNKTIIKKEKYF